MNIHVSEHIRQHMAHKAIRDRLMSAGISATTKPVESEEALQHRREMSIPLWDRKRIYFDAHVKAYQWELAQRESPATFIRRRSDYFGIPYAVMIGPGARREVASRRHLIMWEIIQTMGLSYPQVGRLFGRDHTTVLHGFRKMDALTEGQRSEINVPIAPKEPRVRKI